MSSSIPCLRPSFLLLAMHALNTLARIPRAEGEGARSLASNEPWRYDAEHRCWWPWALPESTREELCAAMAAPVSRRLLRRFEDDWRRQYQPVAVVFNVPRDDRDIERMAMPQQGASG